MLEAAEKSFHPACLRAYVSASKESDDYRASRASAATTSSVQFGVFHSARHTPGYKQECKLQRMSAKEEKKKTETLGRTQILL